MSELSPAAQAVLDAAVEAYGINYSEFHCCADRVAAAALRAATGQVVPEENVDDADYHCLHAKWAEEGKQEVRSSILAITGELEAQ